MRNLIIATITAASLAVPLSAHAQVFFHDTMNDAQAGAQQGDAAAGPIGGLVGGAVGTGVGAADGAVGTATGIVGSTFGAFGGSDDQGSLQDYMMQHPVPSATMAGDVQVGMRLRRSVMLYPVPAGTRVNPYYSYTVVNNQTVIVDPHNRRVAAVMN